MSQTIKVDLIWDERTTPIDLTEVEVLAKDIAANGLRRPLIIDDQAQLIDGLKRLRALRLLGVKTVDVEMASTLPGAIKFLRELKFDPNKLTLRRRRDFGESLDTLIGRYIKSNMARRRADGKIPYGEGTRELVATALGYPWHRIRRIYRWLEQEPTDLVRQDLLQGFEGGTIGITYLYKLIVGEEARKKGRPVPPKVRKSLLMGDISTPREQTHLMTELNRQISGALKGAERLALPITVPPEEFEPMLNELLKHRAAITSFINAIRKGDSRQ